ncbi:universal stress protein [Streptomyces sp. NPDC001982]|uniref:universal stress protein n=1 Tax=Streptomyces sp. NPDC001982 TaxID=3154405 RepID=UPI003322FACF
MRLPLVVGVDGSRSSLGAVDWATDEAARHGVPLRLVYASLWERYEADGTGRMAADDVLATAAERVRRRNPDVEVDGEVLPEDPVDALLHEGRNAAALVTGSRGRGELRGMLLGSVSLAVAGRASGPVVVIRGDGTAGDGTAPDGEHRAIVLGAGDPGTSGAATWFALREAAVRGCDLDVVRAWRRPAHRTAEHPLIADDPAHGHQERASLLIDDLLRDVLADYPDVRVRRSVVEGLARKVLLQRSATAALLVVGVRRARDHGGLQLGRVTHAVLHHAQCPVAVVPELP